MAEKFATISFTNLRVNVLFSFDLLLAAMSDLI
jgi:hypothetical protein